MRVFGAVEGCLGANACRGHVIVSGNIFSRLAPIGPQIAKQSRSYFLGAVLWRQTYVVDICSGRIRGLQSLVIASQHGGGWGWMGIPQFHFAQLRYRYRSCNTDIAVLHFVCDRLQIAGCRLQVSDWQLRLYVRL